MTQDDLEKHVKARYGSAAKAVARAEAASCGGSSGACGGGAAAKDPITRDLYSCADAEGLPQDALLASLGCGNPTALAELRPGETVLDLGSGGGVDVLLSAKRVGPTGKVYGLDMTPEMLALARANQAQAGIANAEFLEGAIEAVPLPDASVDVLISNCVINLSGDKQRVLGEAFRVLRSGGRFAVSDIVLRRELPDELRASMELWTGCVAGALVEADYVRRLEQAGFVDVSIQPTRIYDAGDFEKMAQDAGCRETQGAAEALRDCVMSAFVRARKP